MKRLAWCLGSALGMLCVAVSCTSYPIIKQYRDQADRSLTVPMVQKDLSAHKGATVIWGGNIISVLNDSQGSRVTILETPLDGEGYPLSRNYSRGRFIAVTDKFLDPIIFKNGMRVTLAGTVDGLQTEKLGEGTYTYPVVKILELRYWHNEVYAPYPPYGYPYYHRWWRHGLWWPYDDFYRDDFLIREDMYIHSRNFPGGGHEGRARRSERGRR